MRHDRRDDALDRDAAGLAEIGRAEDRDIGGGAGVLDEIADAHDLADHRDRRLERRAGGALRQRRVGGEAFGERSVGAGLRAGDLHGSGKGEGDGEE